MTTRQTAPAVTLVIPGTLPSLNAIMFSGVGERIANTNAVKWRMKDAWLKAGQPTFTGPVVAVVRCYFPDRRRRDRENVGLKPAIDLLVTVGCIERDDHEYMDLTVEMLHDRERPRVEVELRERGE